MLIHKRVKGNSQLLMRLSMIRRILEIKEAEYMGYYPKPEVDNNLRDLHSSCRVFVGGNSNYRFIYTLY